LLTQEDVENLAPYATSGQLAALRAVHEHGTYWGAAEAIGKDRSNIRRDVKTVMARAARQGFAPAHDMTRTVPDGYKLKGVSTLYNGDGQVSAQWVKSTADHERQAEMMRAVVEAMKEEVPTAERTPDPSHPIHQDLLNLYVITDYHLGMLAWGEETRGDDWDTEVAETMLVDWFRQAIHQAPDSHTGVFAQLGDLMHHDGLDSITPTSGHALDADTRFQKLVRVAIRAIRRVIGMMLAKHEHVHVIMAEGNHDLASSVWLRELFAAMYDGEPRVSVDQSADPYYCYEWGHTSLFFHHGHKRKPENVHDVFAGKFRDVFGRTNHSYAHMGHQHHSHVKETNLMIVEQHRTLAAPDAHASRGGWLSGREASVITYHKNYGQVGRVTITPDMVA